MRLLQLLLLSFLIFWSACKQTPTFSADNPNDPESLEYVVPAPNFPTLEFNPDNLSYKLIWELPTTIYSRTRIERFDPTLESYYLLSDLPKGQDSLIYIPDPYFLNERLRIYNYYVNTEGDSLNSTKLEIYHHQNIIEFNASVDADNKVTLYWHHQLAADDAEIVIIRRSDGSEEEIARLSLADSTYTDPTPADLLAITEYKIFATDNFTQSPASILSIGQNGVRPVERVDLINDDTNRLMVEIETDIESKSDSILIVLESLITGETFVKRQKTHHAGITIVQLNEIEGSLAPYNLNVHNRLYGVSSASYSTILRSEVIFEEPVRTNLSTEINNDMLFIVNNGKSLAYLNISPEEPNIATPSLLSLETGTVTHTFTGDTASFTLEYLESTNTLYANQPEGLLVIDLNTNTERIIERPDALLNNYMLHVDNNSTAYMYNTRHYVSLFDLKSETQIGILETPEPRIFFSPDKEHLFAYTYAHEYYDIYRTSDHSIIYSSSDKIDSLQILPDVFFGNNEMLLRSKYFGLYHLNLTSLEYQYISDNPAYGHNNFHGFYNAQNRNFYSLSRQHNYNTMLSVWDIESKKIIQNLDITSQITRNMASQARLIYSYPTNTLYAFTVSSMFEFPTSFSWSIDD